MRNAECGVRSFRGGVEPSRRVRHLGGHSASHTPHSALLAILTAAPLATVTAQAIPALPDSSGWGVHVLAIARAPDSAIWVGTYGEGIFVLRKGAGTWERIRSSNDTAARAISWDFVHAFGFGPRGQVWYGTVGNPRAAGPIWQRDRHNSPYGTAEANTQLERPARMGLGESNAIFVTSWDANRRSRKLLYCRRS